MKNITIAIDEETMNAGRVYAQAHRTSLNALIRQLLSGTVKPAQTPWTDALFQVADRAAGNSRGQQWRREDLYRG
jgi:plasmid stability protein